MTDLSINRFGHIDLRVTNAEEATKFYGQFLPALGFTRTFHGNGWYAYAGEGELPQVAYFALTEDPAHVPNANRIAFWAESPGEVDRIGEVVRAAGGRNIEGPERCPYSPSYYAVFFEDPSGNRLEVYYRVD